MAKAIAEPPQVKYSASKFRHGKHAPELGILPMLLAAAGAHQIK